MADLHILREHALGFARARAVALHWAEQVEKEFGMACTYEEGTSADTLHFKRSGVQGALQVTKDKFELDAKLGFLLGAFKDRIETEIVKMLDGMAPADATDASAQPAAKPVVKPAAKKPVSRKK
ncbi:MAG: polyhydroxyalkanoic acid system family protein [Rhodoferax sp.]|nr:polyhydroxyalkanoic acid system family protein [Rhodoferax sp.]